MRGKAHWLLILVLVTFPKGLPGDVPGPFDFKFLQEGDRYLFEGRFTSGTDPGLAWEVLTDYDNVSRFVANMNCRVVKREGDELLVDQTVGGGFLFIRQEVKGFFRVKETPPTSICLEELTRRNFDLYQASWNIGPNEPGKGLSVTYNLEARRNRDTPGFVTPELFRQAAQDLVIGMKREMERREARRQSPPET